MKRYRVGIPVYGYLVFDVEAKSRNKAIDEVWRKPLEEYPDNFKCMDYNPATAVCFELDENGDRKKGKKK